MSAHLCQVTHKQGQNNSICFHESKYNHFSNSLLLYPASLSHCQVINKNHFYFFKQEKYNCLAFLDCLGLFKACCQLSLLQCISSCISFDLQVDQKGDENRTMLFMFFQLILGYKQPLNVLLNYSHIPRISPRLAGIDWLRLLGSQGSYISPQTANTLKGSLSFTKFTYKKLYLK